MRKKGNWMFLEVGFFMAGTFMEFGAKIDI